VRYDYLPTCNKDPSTQLYKFPGLVGMGYGGFWLFDTSRTQTSEVNCIVARSPAATNLLSRFVAAIIDGYIKQVSGTIWI
jgi:hypothetical protein